VQNRPPILKPLFLVIVRSEQLICKRRCNHLRKMAHETLFGCLQGRSQLAANGYSRKEGSSPSEATRFKARLVAKGFSQYQVLITMMCSLQL
jgi:hypothetical protein